MLAELGEKWPPAQGRAVRVVKAVVRILAPNPKPYTEAGTNTYLLGDESVWIIDPGPADESHIKAVMAAIKDRPVKGICVTHSHPDHSGAARAFKRLTGAPSYGYGPLDKKLAYLSTEETDPDFEPDIRLACGMSVGGGRWRLEAVHTPGHFPNHICYVWPAEDILFSGDHVMGWSTTSVVPPLGNMHDYLVSLEKLAQLKPTVMLPSHGSAVGMPLARLQEIREHRFMRHVQIGRCLEEGLTDVADIAARLYEDTLPPVLLQAAKGCVAAHLELLADRPGLLSGDTATFAAE